MALIGCTNAPSQLNQSTDTVHTEQVQQSNVDALIHRYQEHINVQPFHDWLFNYDTKRPFFSAAYSKDELVDIEREAKRYLTPSNERPGLTALRQHAQKQRTFLAEHPNLLDPSRTWPTAINEYFLRNTFTNIIGAHQHLNEMEKIGEFLTLWSQYLIDNPNDRTRPKDSEFEQTMEDVDTWIDDGLASLYSDFTKKLHTLTLYPESIQVIDKRALKTLKRIRVQCRALLRDLNNSKVSIIEIAPPQSEPNSPQP